MSEQPDQSDQELEQARSRATTIAVVAALVILLLVGGLIFLGYAASNL